MKKIAKIFCFICLAIFILFFNNKLLAANFCVSTAAELQNALSVAGTNSQDDLIRVQEGTYFGNFIYASTEDFGVKIEGGYSFGCATRVVDPANTVLDAQNNGRVLELTCPWGVSADFTVDGLTLQNGNVIGSHGSGLHILTSRGDVTVTNNKVIDNKNGGGLFVKDADPLNISDNIIANNNAGIASDPGGGIRIIDSWSVILTNNIIRDNVGSSLYSYGGGAFIKCLRDTITLINNTIKYNFPGGLHVQGKDVITLDKNIISNNAGGDWASGADVWAAESIYLKNNILCHNSGANNGGLHIFSVLVNELNLTNNIVCKNNASHLGGGIYIELSDIASANLNNNTIWGNSAVDNGGGIWLSLNHDLDRAYFYNNIILNNTLDGGFTVKDDLYILNDGNNNNVPSPVFLYNNDLDLLNGVTIQNTHSVIYSNNLNNENPLFVDSTNNNYHLTASAPCIDAGTSVNPPDDDIDGDLRPQGAGYDIGADEYMSEISIDTIIDFFEQSVFDGTIYGSGKKQNIAKLKLWIFSQTLKNAKYFIENDEIENACKALNRAFLRCDSDPWPIDFVEGEDVVELADMILELMDELGCQ
jgi:hypothetical protein